MADNSRNTTIDVIESHIEITPGTCGGKPRISGHRILVQDIALWTEEGRSADEIVAEFPQLSLSDVYAALTYYHDHRQQIDQDIQEDEEFLAQIMSNRKLNRQKDTNGGNSISS
jgi:uncharacterized protein (DUF433 family)